MRYFPGNTKVEVRKLVFSLFDIFGEYYVLNPGKEPKFIKYTGEAANKELSLQPQQISESYKNYLVNVSICLL